MITLIKIISTFTSNRKLYIYHLQCQLFALFIKWFNEDDCHKYQNLGKDIFVVFASTGTNRFRVSREIDLFCTLHDTAQFTGRPETIFPANNRSLHGFHRHFGYGAVAAKI